MIAISHERKASKILIENLFAQLRIEFLAFVAHIKSEK